MTSQQPIDRWYYAKDKKKVGPVSRAQLQRLLAQGVLQAEDLVLQEGAKKWRPLAEVVVVKPRAWQARILTKRPLIIGAVAAALVVLLSWGLVALLKRPSPTADVQAEKPPAKRPNKPKEQGGPSKRGDPKGTPHQAPNAEPNPEFTSTDSPPDVPTRLVVQLGHSSHITSLAISGDGKLAATAGASRDGVIVWDVLSGKEVQRIRFDAHAAHTVALSGDGRMLAIGSTIFALGTGAPKNPPTTATLAIWDVASGKEIQSFKGHVAGVTSVSLSADGKWLASGSRDQSARLWDVASGKEVQRCQHVNRVVSVALSGDGAWLATACLEGTARLWDARTGKEIRSLPAKDAKGFAALGLSRDGKLLAAASGDKTTGLWDALSGKELHSFQGGFAALSADGTRLATRLDNAACVWDTASGKEVQRVRRDFSGASDMEKRSPAHAGVAAAALSPDGKKLATVFSNYFTPSLWDVDSGREILRFRGYARTVNSLNLAGDGRLLAATGQDYAGTQFSGGNIKARLWDVAAGKEVPWVREPAAQSFGRQSLRAFALSWDGKWVATASADNSARLWEASTGKELQRFSGHSNLIWSLAFSRDGQWLATGAKDNTARLWETSTGKLLRIFRGHTGSVTSVAFSEDGKWLATASQDNTARLWDVSSAREKRRIQGHNEAGHDSWIKNTAVSADGKLLATSNWSVKANKLRTLAGFLENTLTTTTANLWDTASGKEVHWFRVPDRIGYLQALALSADGKRLATATFDGAARLWDATSGKELHAFQGHSVALTRNGKWLLTGSNDHTVRLWDAAEGKELCRLFSFLDGSWAVVDTQGRYDAANGGDIEGLHWVAGTEVLALKQLKERYYDPGLLAKHMGFNKEPLRNVKAFKDVKLFADVTVAKGKDPVSTKLDLDLVNRGGGIGKVQVFVNGMELLADARGPKFEAGQAKARLTVDLADAPSLRPGQKNQITVVTWNREGYLSSRGLKLNWDAPGKKDERRIELYAIVGGISEYAGPNLRLRYAAKDAEDIAQALTLGARRLFGADSVHVTLLTTSARAGAMTPTRANFEKAFMDVRRKARPDDVLVVYLAGHGVSLGTGSDQYCYLTRDARTADAAALSDPALLAQTTITSSELTEWVKKIPALKQVLVLDTCAAGAAAAKLTEVRQVTGDQVRALERLKDRTGFHVLMGCAADKVSYEATPFEQGLLTHALLKGMRGAALNQDEYLDVSKLFQYAADEVPELARGIGGVQKPLIVAPRGTSFDVARFTTADRAAVPLKTVKPLVLRPVLLNPDKGFDDLGLMVELRKQLANAVVPSGRGTGKQAVFVDTEEMPGAVRPSGTYTVSGGKVEVQLRLIRDGVPLHPEPLRIEGVLSDRAALVSRLTETIFREAWSGLKR